MPSYRTSKSYGERQEYAAISELLKRGFDVYKTLVDDQQIDCIVRIDNGLNPKYLDIQIKARSKDCQANNAGRFAGMDIPNPRKNYFFIFYDERVNTYWVIPSLELVQFASKSNKGENAGKYHIHLTLSSNKKNEVKCNPKYAKYENAFRLLK